MIPTLTKKYNLKILGNLDAPETLLFAHGFGSNQTAWRYITPAFEAQYRVVLFDLVGSSRLSQEEFNLLQYQSLADYAEDFIKICDGLDFTEDHRVTLIAHSVSCMLGTFAALKRPRLFHRLIFLCASPCYLSHGDYAGGLSQDKVTKMLEGMTDNYSQWIRTYAPVVMGNPQHPDLTAEFAQCLLKLRPDITLVIFSMIVLSDCRQEVAKLGLPVLILQPEQDVFVPQAVGDYLHQVIPHSQLQRIPSQGHFPHLSNPQEVIKAITDYLELEATP